MDYYDRSSHTELLHREAALAAQRMKMPARESLHACDDCAMPIPEARRKAVPGVTRCVACQEDHEKKQRMKAP